MDNYTITLTFVTSIICVLILIASIKNLIHARNQKFESRLNTVKDDFEKLIKVEQDFLKKYDAIYNIKPENLRLNLDSYFDSESHIFNKKIELNLDSTAGSKPSTDKFISEELIKTLIEINKLKTKLDKTAILAKKS